MKTIVEHALKWQKVGVNSRCVKVYVDVSDVDVDAFLFTPVISSAHF